ncbi:bifunctional phosphopantothenoylcysteine decarboxylase/phosphopantothenate--cysteine ligase CoaBC [Clostridium formicaceticum]|uniref:Coenzyme A biosynthesis bifunctional protein CoaBC n=1 Tax=Clostridium formicaceticum TaxID=1497 RepID=A0AAC9RLM3_9CLOT|nr:bifunctional phosphopantothenoylcysteine decarboxylase/phosphopantothenate--cysteine ligase CoaBC [Clostridium formicaceticum]AOY77373.1 bifunctional 4'-phosphopantothenoylcysteine decarboxylase/phosphopantothenoylcysteine synthetase [Clostridium formicaceticum]ARE87922.1 Coenzyme A biosynthesis bifunctional protein CoaBC [Clostridium formicaceticum]
MLKGKNIVVGVTGGIAAYKACDIVSRLKKLQANVDVIMTKTAMAFVQPHTLQALSQNPVITELFETPRYWDIEHISLAQKADILLVAPATANIIGKVAHGIADDLLSTTIMASTAKVVFAPAMNTKMYQNVIFQSNMEKLKALGYHFIPPASGRLACGDIGEGKLAEVDAIIEFMLELGKEKKDLEGKKVLITAGPTVEAIDPVRFITNHSSGKMGYALAEAASKRGASVTLVSGPTKIMPPSNINFVPIKSTLDMYDAVMKHFPQQDVIIKSAAVADYRPQYSAEKKIKKQEGDLTLTLVRNPDILFELGQIKEGKILVGFAAETDHVLEYAKEKILKKNLDFIVANDVTQEGAGFGTDTNIVYLIDKTENITKIDKSSKTEIAHHILNKVKELL